MPSPLCTFLGSVLHFLGCYRRDRLDLLDDHAANIQPNDLCCVGGDCESFSRPDPRCDSICPGLLNSRWLSFLSGLRSISGNHAIQITLHLIPFCLFHLWLILSFSAEAWWAASIQLRDWEWEEDNEFRGGGSSVEISLNRNGCSESFWTWAVVWNARGLHWRGLGIDLKLQFRVQAPQDVTISETANVYLCFVNMNVSQ